MPHVMRRALDPCVAPGRILRRHTDHEAPDVGQHPGLTRPSGVCPLLGDKLTMPPQQRVRRHDRGHSSQRLTAHLEGAYGEPPPVFIGQAHAPPSQLSPEEAVFLDQVGKCFPLSAIQPAGQYHQQHLDGRRVDHERELISRSVISAPRLVDPAAGHFAIALVVDEVRGLEEKIAGLDRQLNQIAGVHPVATRLQTIRADPSIMSSLSATGVPTMERKSSTR